jgi:ATP-dependent RNA helicase DOB1
MKPDEIPLLHPVKDLGIKDDAFQTLLGRAETLTKRLASHELSSKYDKDKLLSLVQAYEKKADMMEHAKVLRDKAHACQSIALKENLKKREKVLKRLGHFDSKVVIAERPVESIRPTNLRL